ncbi:MAG: Rieske (2Fe-2S) protein [Candidatus Aenigmarchaeota archaeon]|nr:Rieske (2Fe-2S) protein [Candidatus Aenigmarchaeota archaeon]
MAWTKVAALQDLREGEGRVVQAGGQALALFLREGKVYAISNTCLHRGGPLGEGSLDGKVVTCPWHGWQYDIATGANQTNPALPVRAYPVQVQGGDVLVDV